MNYRFGDAPRDKEVMKFVLYANAYREDAKYRPYEEGDEKKFFASGISYGGIYIDSVTSDGKTLDNELIGEDKNVLSINTKEAGDVLEIKFSVLVPEANGRLGINGGRINLGDLLPAACVYENGGYAESVYSAFGDPYYSEACDYSVSITLPSEYVAASSGFPELTEAGDTSTTYSYSLKGGRDFAFVLGKEFSVCEKEISGIKISYYADVQDEEGLELAADCIRFFSETFGDYPYSSFSVAETGLNAAGMEYSGMCFIANDLSAEEKRAAIIHEVAHEWWHGGVGNDQVRAAFIDEGLAEYSAYLYIASRYGEDAADVMTENAKSAYKSFFSLKDLLAGNADTSMTRSLYDFSGKYEYVNVAYNKSLIMFKEYENTFGRDKCVKRLKKMYGENLYKNVTPDSLIDHLGAEDFFRSYFDGKVLI